MNCLICGSNMFGPYACMIPYYSSPGTWLHDVPVYRCKCGEEEYSLPQVAKLEELLGDAPTSRNLRWTEHGWIAL